VSATVDEPIAYNNTVLEVPTPVMEISVRVMSLCAPEVCNPILEVPDEPVILIETVATDTLLKAPLI